MTERGDRWTTDEMFPRTLMVDGRSAIDSDCLVAGLSVRASKVTK